MVNRENKFTNLEVSKFLIIFLRRLQSSFPMPSILVLIVRGETHDSDRNIASLKQLFQSSEYLLEVITIRKPQSTGEEKDHPHYMANYRLRKVLAYAANYASLPCLILQDSSTTHLTSETLKGHLSSSALTAADAVLLCKWNDVCHQYIDVSRETPHLKWSPTPRTLQAFFLRPPSRDLFLTSLKTSPLKDPGDVFQTLASNRQLSVMVYSPNLFNFDINLARKAQDFSKLNECIPIVSGTQMLASAGFWTTILVVVLLAIVCIVIASVQKAN